MGLSITSWIEILGLLLGGGGIGYLITIKYKMKQANGEARSAENEATKSVQDIYQEMIKDVNQDRQEQKEYISELKEERRNLRQERDESRKENKLLQKRLSSLEEKIRDLERGVARQGRKLEIIDPFLCGRNCQDRIHTTVKDIMTIAKSTNNNNKKKT